MVSPRQTWTKTYDSPRAAATAAAHHAWLASLDSGIHLPALHHHTGRHLTFEFLTGTSPAARQLPALAIVLGRLHAAAYRAHLYVAHLDRPITSPNGHVIPDFVTGRAAALRAVPPVWVGQPAVIYKDSNLRNFVVPTSDDGHQAAIVDFDDLTLAPVGYDLAKLLVSATMTYGRLPQQVYVDTMDAYIVTFSSGTGITTPCTATHIRAYCEIHHHVTHRYQGRNGYTYRWDETRPWPRPGEGKRP